MPAEEFATPEQEHRGVQDSVEQLTPLPRAQLFSVGLIQLAEPIAALCIYPFINQFVRETGITGGDERKTGYYAGVIESTFFLSESLSVVPWGYLSDRVGRRPIALIAPLGLGVAMLSFGLSSTFWSMLMARCMQGIFNGNVGVARTMIGEMTDESNRGDAFAYIPMIWSVGSTSSQIIGGFLSNPEKRWPNGIGQIRLLKQHPYFLPCAAAGSVAFTAFIVACLILKETLPSLVARERQKQTLGGSTLTEESPLLGSSSSSSEDEALPPGDIDVPKPPRFRDAFTRPIMVTVITSGFLAFIDMCHGSLLPLMWSTSIPYGGLGLDPLHIGLALGTYGFFNALIQIKITGRLIRHFGPATVFRLSISSPLLCFAMYPTMKYFAQRAGRVDGFVIAGIIVQMCCNTLLCFAYAAIQILVVESVPAGGPLGTANGLAQMAGSGMRTIAPTLATSLFALSLERNLAGGNMVYYIFIGIAFVGLLGTVSLPAGKSRVGSRS